MSAIKASTPLKKFLVYIAGDLMNDLEDESIVLSEKLDVTYNTVKRIRRYSYDILTERLIENIGKMGSSVRFRLDSGAGYCSRNCNTLGKVRHLKKYMGSCILEELENRAVRWELQNYISPLSLKRMASKEYDKVRLEYYVRLWTELNFNISVTVGDETVNIGMETDDPVIKLRLGLYRVIRQSVTDGSLRPHVLMETFDHLRLGRYWKFSTDDLLRMVCNVRPATLVNLKTGVIQ